MWGKYPFIKTKWSHAVLLVITAFCCYCAPLKALTCRNRGCWDTACMACELSRVGCRGTAPLCNLGIKQQNLFSTLRKTTGFLFSSLWITYREVQAPWALSGIRDLFFSNSMRHAAICIHSFNRDSTGSKSVTDGRRAKQTYLTFQDGSRGWAEPAADSLHEEGLNKRRETFSHLYTWHNI